MRLRVDNDRFGRHYELDPTDVLVDPLFALDYPLLGLPNAHTIIRDQAKTVSTGQDVHDSLAVCVCVCPLEVVSRFLAFCFHWLLRMNSSVFERAEVSTQRTQNQVNHQARTAPCTPAQW